MTRTPRRSQLGPALVLALATLAARPALVLALAALAPAGLAGAQPIDAWIDGLTAPKWEAREMAAINLGRFPARAKPALPALIRALDDSHPRVRMAVAGALFQLGPAAAEATPILIEHLRRDPDPKVRQLSAIALGQIGPPAAEALPALVEALRDPSDGVRLRAAVAAEVFDPQASRPVDALVHDLRGDGPTRLRAGWALSQAGAAAAPAIDALVAALGDPDRSVQLVATVALEQIGRPVEAAIPDLVRAAEAGNWHAGSVLEHLGKAARARGQPLYWVAAYTLWEEALLFAAGLLAWFALGAWIRPNRAKRPVEWVAVLLVNTALPTLAVLGLLVHLLIRHFGWLAEFVPSMSDLAPTLVIPGDLAFVCSLALTFALIAVAFELRRPLAPDDPAPAAAPESDLTANAAEASRP